VNFFLTQYVVKTSPFRREIIILQDQDHDTTGNGMGFESMNRGELQQPPEKSAVRSKHASPKSPLSKQMVRSSPLEFSY
jgi:hypothetical protein